MIKAFLVRYVFPTFFRARVIFHEPPCGGTSSSTWTSSTWCALHVSGLCLSARCMVSDCGVQPFLSNARGKQEQILFSIGCHFGKKRFRRASFVCSFSSHGQVCAGEGAHGSALQVSFHVTHTHTHTCIYIHIFFRSLSLSLYIYICISIL